MVGFILDPTLPELPPSKSISDNDRNNFILFYWVFLTPACFASIFLISSYLIWEKHGAAAFTVPKDTFFNWIGYAADNVSNTLFFDCFEIFHFKLTTIEHAENVWVGVLLLSFRLVIGAFVLGYVAPSATIIVERKWLSAAESTIRASHRRGSLRFAILLQKWAGALVASVLVAAWSIAVAAPVWLIFKLFDYLHLYISWFGYINKFASWFFVLAFVAVAFRLLHGTTNMTGLVKELGLSKVHKPISEDQATSLFFELIKRGPVVFCMSFFLASYLLWRTYGEDAFIVNTGGFFEWALYIADNICSVVLFGALDAFHIKMSPITHANNLYADLLVFCFKALLELTFVAYIVFSTQFVGELEGPNTTSMDNPKA